jgi:dUTP pyrophosphatase
MSYVPKYQTKLAAGLDLPAAEFGVVPPGSTLAVDTGLTLKDLLPKDLEAYLPILNVSGGDYTLYAEIRSRSGLAFKYNVHAFHGIIDLDYSDTIKVLLINNGKEKFEVHPSDRIAQLVFGLTYRPTHLLTDTERTGGFGSTDVKEETTDGDLCTED